MKRGYARVSTEDQHLDLQRQALQEAGCEAIYEDTISGSTTSRPELDRLLADCQAGDAVVVWRLDRLGRSVVHLIRTVAGLGERGVDFVSLQEAIDTSTAGGRLVFHIFCALAEFERGIISERTKAGLAATKRNGTKLGPKRKLVGERLDLAVSLLEQGHSRNAVARKLGVSRETLRRNLPSA